MTSRAAAAVGRSADLGSLRPGMAGDAAVLDFEEGHFRFVDGAGHEVRAERRLRTRAVVKDGRRVALPEEDSDLV